MCGCGRWKCGRKTCGHGWKICERKRHGHVLVTMWMDGCGRLFVNE